MEESSQAPFGPYQAVREIFWGLEETVYRAQHTGSAERKDCFVRLFHPHSPAVNDHRIEAFLAWAKTETEAKQNGQAFTAPIAGYGQDNRGGWFAFRFLGCTFHQLIEHRVVLDAESLHRCLAGLVGRLRTFHTVHGRGHGKLRPENLFVEHQGDLVQAEVWLGEPVSLGTQTSEREDLSQLGELLFQLVRAESVKAAVEFPHLALRNWRVIFGKEAEGWQQLCHDLLAPDLASGEMNFDVIERRLRELAPPESIRRCAQRYWERVEPVRLPALRLMLLLALLGASWLFLRLSPTESSPPWLKRLARLVGCKNVYPPEWEQWTQARAWLADLLAVERISPAWSTDSYLNHAFIPELDRARLQRASARELVPLRPSEVNEASRKALLGSWVRRAGAIRDALTVWPLRKELEDGAHWMNRLGWNGPATELADKAGGLKFHGLNLDSTNVVVRIDEMLSAANSFNQLAAGWKIITNVTERPIPGLSALGENIRAALTRQTNLVALLEALRPERDSIRELDTFLISKWATVAPVCRTSYPPPGRWTNRVEQLRLWLQQVSECGSRNSTPSTELDSLLAFRIPYSEVVHHEWEVRRAKLTSNPAAKENLLSNLKNLLQFLQALATNPPPPVLNTAGIRPDFAQSLREEAERRREALLIGALTHINWEYGLLPADSFEDFIKQPTNASLATDYAQELAGLEAFGKDITALPARLALGYGIPNWQRFLHLETNAAFGQVFGPLEDLEDLRTNPALPPEELLTRVKSPEATLAAAWTAWQRLTNTSQTWMTNLTELEAMATTGHVLSNRVAMIPNEHAARRDELRLALASNALSLLRSCFALFQPDDARISQALIVLNRSALTNGVRLTRADEFNLYLHQLRTEDFSKHTTELAAWRDRLVSQARVLALIPLEESTLTKLEQIDFQATLAPVSPDPELDKFRARWVESSSPDGATLVYNWTSKSGTLHRLDFVQIAGPQPPTNPEQTAFYLGTTEIPVGLVADWMATWRTNPDEWRQMTNAMPALAVPASQSDKDDIVTWELNPRCDPPLRPASKWLREAVELTQLEYANVPPPNLLTPMTHIPPQAARVLARWMGFRLPTTNEWLAAYAATGNAPDYTHPNLRDRTWQREQQYLSERLKQLKQTVVISQWPDSGVFDPRGAAESPARGAAALSLSNYDDGWLWFADVNAGGRGLFHHLVGNVAEFLYEPGQGSARGTFFVIGGSALSDPTLRTDQPMQLRVAQLKTAKSGFADVGLRLARDAALSPAWKFKSLVKLQKYVVAAGPSG